MSALAEVWRGGVNAWECDEMGHLNVRFHLARAMQGLAGLAAELGLADAFSARATATLAVKEQHIRFLREARAGAPLTMQAGVLALEETEAVIVQVMRHSLSGEIAATYLTRVAHVAIDGRSFPWPARTRSAAVALATEAIEPSGPRSIPDAPTPPAPEGAMVSGRFMVEPGDTDAFGRMRPELVIGRISECIPHLLEPVRREIRAAVPEAARVGGAALEYRLTYFGAPAAGELLVLRSALAEVGEKLLRCRHWLLDARTGRPWASAEHISVSFDLDARKTIAIPVAALAKLQSLVRT